MRDEITPDDTPQYFFDGFVVDPANRTVVRDGVPVPIAGKAFDVLVELIKGRGRLLEKDELLAKVWSGSFVEEGTLARNISQIRKALGDDHRGKHKYIITVQRHGYRFIAEVYDSPVMPPSSRNSDNGSADDVPYRAQIRPHSTWRPTYVFWALVAVVVVGSVLSLSLLGLRVPGGRSRYSFENARFSNLTQTGKVYGPHISRDGQYLAYVSDDERQPGICVRHLASGSVLQVLPYSPGTAVWGVVIAPDNSFLYYVLKEADSESGTLFRIPFLGGQPFKIATDVSGAAISDGNLVFVSTDRPNRLRSLIISNPDGTDPRTLHSISFDDLYHAIDFSPDGKTLGVSIKHAQPGGSFTWRLVELSLADGSETFIGHDPKLRVIGLVWLPDKSGMIVNATDPESKRAQLHHVSYPDGARHPVTNDLNHYQGISMTADGSKLVAMQQRVGRQLWTIVDGRSSALITDSPRDYDSLNWIADNVLIYSEDDGGTGRNHNLWRILSDGSQKQQITFGGNARDLTVSADRQHIAFVSDRSGKSQIWRATPDGRDLIQVTNVNNDVIVPGFSADGSRIFFLAWVETGYRMWQVPVEGGEVSEVVDEEIYYYWALSPDGEHLAYMTFDEAAKRRRARIYSLSSKQVVDNLDIDPQTWMAWSNDGKKIYYTRESDGVTNVWQIELNGHDTEPITNFSDQTVYRFSSSTSGRLAVVRQNVAYDAVALSPR